MRVAHGLHESVFGSTHQMNDRCFAQHGRIVVRCVGAKDKDAELLRFHGLPNHGVSDHNIVSLCEQLPVIRTPLNVHTAAEADLEFTTSLAAFQADQPLMVIPMVV